MSNRYHTLYSPLRPVGSTGSAFAVHFTPNEDEVEIMNHNIDMGCSMPIATARIYYKSLLDKGYTKPMRLTF